MSRLASSIDLLPTFFYSILMQIGQVVPHLSLKQDSVKMSVQLSQNMHKLVFNNYNISFNLNVRSIDTTVVQNLDVY